MQRSPTKVLPIPFVVYVYGPKQRRQNSGPLNFIERATQVGPNRLVVARQPVHVEIDLVGWPPECRFRLDQRSLMSYVATTKKCLLKKNVCLSVCHITFLSGYICSDTLRMF